LKVSSLHAAGDIEREHDVAGTKPDLAQVPELLRPSQREDQEHRAE
jgi:hypothetical protein